MPDNGYRVPFFWRSLKCSKIDYDDGCKILSVYQKPLNFFKRVKSGVYELYRNKAVMLKQKFFKNFKSLSLVTLT